MLTVIGVAAITRIAGMAMIVGLAGAVAAGIVLRHALLRRSERRTTVWRLTVMVSIMVALAWTSFSYTGALTDAGSDPVTDRTATWMRTHHLNVVVDAVEQRRDQQSMATNGVIDPATLPNTPGASAAAPTPRPPTPTAFPTALTTVPATAPATVPPTTTAPVDHTPPPAGPLIDALLVGEGIWTPNAREVGGVPATYTTFVRPDPTNTGVVAAAVVLDPTATKLVYVPGTQQPGGTGWAWGGGIPIDQRPDLVAAFNSGWKENDHPGGAYTEGRTAVDMIGGAASLVIYADGHSDVGAWGTDVTMTPDVASVRQNLVLVVTDSRPVAGLEVGGTGNWGTTKYQTQHTRRSGLGITADGALVYVAGSSLTTQTLAHALVQVGAVRGMELDIHHQHPTSTSSRRHPGCPMG